MESLGRGRLAELVCFAGFAGFTGFEDEDADEPDLLGLYVGVPLVERGHEPPIGPARILVYRKPLLDMCDSPQELRDEIRITVLHEIAHHFGIEDERLDELGYG